MSTHTLAFFKGKRGLWFGALLVPVLGLAAWLGVMAAFPPPAPQGVRAAPTVAASTPVASTPTSVPTEAPSISQIGAPQRLIIPSIGVDASVEQVQVTENHDLQVPQIQPFDNVGWYAHGPKPGERGNATIDGHLDRKDGSPAVFWDLKKLQPGAQIIVVDTFGHRYSFHVEQVGRFSPYEAPPADIFGPSQGVHLNLLTCAGTWIPAQHQTNQRLVVYATLDA
ncbi:MAG TPA: class F sortase [Ktedonobacterales bacterium]